MSDLSGTRNRLYSINLMRLFSFLNCLIPSEYIIPRLYSHIHGIITCSRTAECSQPAILCVLFLCLLVIFKLGWHAITKVVVYEILDSHLSGHMMQIGCEENLIFYGVKFNQREIEEKKEFGRESSFFPLFHGLLQKTVAPGCLFRKVLYAKQMLLSVICCCHCSLLGSISLGSNTIFYIAS